MKNNFSTIIDILKNNKKFTVTSHIMPDGDAIGSVLALTLTLIKMGKDVKPVFKDPIPDNFTFLPGSEKLSNKLPGKSDALICLDCGDADRIGFDKDIKNMARIVINIDHHKSNSFFGDINYVDETASSVGEILFYFIRELIDIDVDIALCLYTSIITDTGSIGYSNTSSSTLRILAELLDMGVKPDYVRKKVFESKSLASLRLLQLTLNTLEVLKDGQIACLYVTRDMLIKSGASDEETDGLINYARSIVGVEVAAIFKEMNEGTIKVGLRSNDWVDVSEIAEEFGGGGHSRAAGYTVRTNIKDAREQLLTLITKYLNGGN